MPHTTNEDLRELMSVSVLEIIPGEDFSVSVTSMNDGRNVKCPRCWHWHSVVSNFGHLAEEEVANPALANEKLCDPCHETILEFFPNHASVPHIKAALVLRT